MFASGMSYDREYAVLYGNTSESLNSAAATVGLSAPLRHLVLSELWRKGVPQYSSLPWVYPSTHPYCVPADNYPHRTLPVGRTAAALTSEQTIREPFGWLFVCLFGCRRS